MAGVGGFEPPYTWVKAMCLYHLAIPQYGGEKRIRTSEWEHPINTLAGCRLRPTRPSLHKNIIRRGFAPRMNRRLLRLVGFEPAIPLNYHRSLTLGRFKHFSASTYSATYDVNCEAGSLLSMEAPCQSYSILHEQWLDARKSIKNMSLFWPRETTLSPFILHGQNFPSLSNF